MSRNGNGNGHLPGNGQSHGATASTGKPADESIAILDSEFARFQSDAPSCDNCGAITVRNGNCYLCHNCGNSMGCS